VSRTGESRGNKICWLFIRARTIPLLIPIPLLMPILDTTLLWLADTDTANTSREWQTGGRLPRVTWEAPACQSITTVKYHSSDGQIGILARFTARLSLSSEASIIRHGALSLYIYIYIYIYMEWASAKHESLSVGLYIGCYSWTATPRLESDDMWVSRETRSNRPRLQLYISK